MLTTKKLIFRTLIILPAFYILICAGLYFFQEKLLFFPDKLDKAYRFSFTQPYEELNFKTEDGKLLNGLLFKADSAKGLVFYLHGNAGSLDSWGDVAKRYTSLQYSVFILDYPGYGKSEGTIKSKSQLFDAVQTAYDNLKKRFHEDSIVVLGYSIGTGPAAYIAAHNHPRLLILQAPYYNLTDMMRRTYPVIPTFLLKYKFQTNEYLKECKMPVIIFHGDQDEVIYYGSSLKLKEDFKTGDTLITLKGQGHNGITDNSDYAGAIKTILESCNALTEKKPNDLKTQINKTPAIDGVRLDNYFNKHEIKPLIAVNNVGGRQTEVRLSNHQIKWLDADEETKIEIDNELFSLKNKATLNIVWQTKDSVDFANNWDEMKLYKIDDRELIGIRMSYQPCTGLGCSVDYFLVYDIKTKTKNFFGTFRTGNQLALYNFNNDGKIDYLAKTFTGDVQGSTSMEFIYNLFSMENNGKFVEQKDSKGQTYQVKQTTFPNDTTNAETFEQRWFVELK